jgi:hypothetical protein
MALRLTKVSGPDRRVLHLCSVCELSEALSENRRILYRQNEVQETQCSLFPIYRRLLKLDVNPLEGGGGRIRNHKRACARRTTLAACEAECRRWPEPTITCLRAEIPRRIWSRRTQFNRQAALFAPEG